jgi:predicted aminopeptidase
MVTKGWLMVLVVAAVAGHSGCYYVHLASGQWRVLRASRAIDDVLADPATDTELRSRLERVLEARAYAAEIGLAVDDQYTSYVPWPDDRIVTTIVATRPGEIEPAGFDFPIVGHVPYKGFFDQARAEADADALRDQGLDVCVLAIPAYSTLGWLADPVTDPMLQYGEHYLVETVIHELVHATVFFADAADFNEGIATFIGQEGAVRFYARRGRGEAMRAAVTDERRVHGALLAVRQEIGALYAATSPGAERDRRRAEIETRARERLASLPLERGDAAAIAESARLNDACLSVTATYASDVPAYARRLDALGGDLAAFVALARSVEDAEDPRAAILGAGGAASADAGTGGSVGSRP